MQKSLAWYPWFPGDWLREARGWPYVARGVVRELFDVQWDRGSLPTKPATLREMIQATPDDWRVAWPYVEATFPIKNGRRRNPALHAKREKAEALVATRTRAAQARWGKRGKVLHLRRDDA
jgi:hypothetical protein